MIARKNLLLLLAFAWLVNTTAWLMAADADAKRTIPAGIQVEALPPADSTAAKVVLIAGSSYFKPGEHEYIGGCAALLDLLKQSPQVFPVLAIDWPKKPETLAGAKAVVFFFDGGDKHAVLQGDHLTQVQQLSNAKIGLVNFHQAFDYPQALGDRAKEFMGAAWVKGSSMRGHWINEFNSFSDHPICRGVTPFKIDDGFLTKLHFVPEMKSVTPLLKVVNPKAPKDAVEADSIVAWTYDRAAGGRSFTFTGCHLHKSLAEEGYRRFLVNGILWAASVEIPAGGAPVNLASTDLAKYIEKK